MTCPRCGAPAFRVARTRVNLGRVGASVALLPFYLLGGLAGDDRGPLLPLERRCAACGHSARGRSVADQAAAWARHGTRRPS